MLAMRLLVLCAVIVATFFVLSRSQVNENAQLMLRSGAVLTGTISRDFLSGDYVVTTKDDVHQIPQAQTIGMVYQGRSLSTLAFCLGGVAILAAGLLTMTWPVARRGSRTDGAT